MRRTLTLFAVVAAGLAAGAGTVLAVDAADRDDPTAAPAPPAVADAARTATEPVLLVWTPDGLPPGLADDVRALDPVTRLTEVRGDLVEMPAPGGPPGFVVPLDALAVDPGGYAAFLPAAAAEAFAALGPGDAVVGETSARLRGAVAGSELTLTGGRVARVAAVVDDAYVAGAELVVAHGALAEVTTPRFLLVAYDGPRDAAERAIRAALPADAPVRFRAPGETPLLRHGDAVLPQAAVKERFGEFSYRRGADRALELDPAWVAAHVVEADVPLLGRVRCHRAVVDELRAALVDLEQRNLGYLLGAEGYQGCFVPRLVDERGGVSRHAWGIALDVNWPKNREGELGTQDVRLVDTMAEHGFTWGGPWLVPDPAHFEWAGRPGYGD